MLRFDLIVTIGLAAWRLGYMMVKEDGPGFMFATLRARMRGFKAFECVYCLTVWIAAAMVLLRNPLRPLINVLAVAGIAAVVQRWLGFDFN